MASLRERLAVGAGLIALTATALPGYYLLRQAEEKLRAGSEADHGALARSLAEGTKQRLAAGLSGFEAFARRADLLHDPARLPVQISLLAASAKDWDDLMVIQKDGTVLAWPRLGSGPPLFNYRDQLELMAAALKTPGKTVTQLHKPSPGTAVLRVARSMGFSTLLVGQWRVDAASLGLSGKGLEPGLALTLRDKEGAVLFQLGEGRKGSASQAEVGAYGWALGLSSDTNFAPPSLIALRRSLIGLCLLSTLLASFLAWVLAARLAKGLQALGQAALRLGQGDYEPQGLELEARGSELGQSAAALSYLATALKQQTKEKTEAQQRALGAERRRGQMELRASLRQMAAGLAKVLAGGAARGSLQRDLADYAAPKVPKRRTIDVRNLTVEAFNSAKELRQEHYRLRLRMSKPLARADREHFRLLLRLLMENAMDAMPKGGLIQASLSRHEGRWRLVVRDQGPAVPAAEREALFRPYYGDKPRGGGLRLALARNLVAAHNGSLICKGGREKGARLIAEWGQPKTHSSLSIEAAAWSPPPQET